MTARHHNGNTADPNSRMLPLPEPEEIAHGEELARHVRQEMTAAGGAISFARFMELALYAPGLGYYAAGKKKFGAAGDFVTAPEIGSLFARCLARQCQEILTALTSGDILEVGAGSGVLAAQLLQELDTLGSLPKNYFILDLSAELRARQAQTIQRQAPHLLARVHWLDSLPDDFHGMVLGNELLDAMPVERFCLTPTGVNQLHVAWENERFVWRKNPAPLVMQNRIQAFNLAPDYTSEINFHAEAWIRSVADCLKQGAILLIDYGFPRTEFYHAQRSQGTLMCHYRHRAHDDPLILLGLQDITAHVDFSAIAEAGVDAGLSLLGYASQAAFLIGCGLESLTTPSDPQNVRAHLELTQQIKKLTLPHEMGELYKVIALGRGLTEPLLGFSFQDRRGRL